MGHCAMARASYLKSARYGAWHPATGLVLRCRVAVFVFAVDTRALSSIAVPAAHRSFPLPICVLVGAQVLSTVPGPSDLMGAGER